MFFQSSEGVMVRWTTKMRGLMLLLAIVLIGIVVFRRRTSVNSITRSSCFCSYSASASGFASSVDYDFEHCENIVLRWVDSSVNDGTEENKSDLQDLLFFLHVPRTGGRTYFHCFLRKLYTSDQECPRSYDKLRFDPSKPNCRLMVTHDDYSVMSKLPREKTSVVTVLRNPLDRVFSTYEFSVEVAARFLVHPNLTSATQMTHKLRSKSRGVSTLDIWPWKYLVPWMREDLFARRDARGNRRIMKEAEDPYNMGEIVMPLRAFINDPLAHEIIHNGATFQVTGLTNNSCLAESQEIRRCVRVHSSLGKYILHVAKKRLERMLYVGLTEYHKESATMFADVVGAQVLSQLQVLASQPEEAANNRTEPGSLINDSEIEDLSHQQNTSDDNILRNVSSGNSTVTNQNMTVGRLMEAYEQCISSLRKSQSVRRTSSLKKISPANFTKEARLHVPDSIIQQILSFNSLDVELYKHAQKIFSEQRELFMLKNSEKGNQLHDNMFDWLPKRVLIVIILLSHLFVFYLVNVRRRTLKLKV
ncbi:protein-tyrosine sulfotransferase isoform X2 [Nymphaea colorata]|uniref:protein-tyrosine sulfotransferase isoform X2 n=1 Tax=Nymphaea colorata TaxID=210225 RepID=UPI00129EDEBC|nr:protein-tyrosine sulfotransferase isoform X2 [Nymphaea colorata]